MKRSDFILFWHVPLPGIGGPGLSLGPNKIQIAVLSADMVLRQS